MDAGALQTPPVGSGRRAELSGGTLSCWDAGSTGPVVRLVHGVPTNQVLCWDVVPRLAPHARVLAVHPLGYDRSNRPDDRPADVAARAPVVGHDIGGRWLLMLALGAATELSRAAIAVLVAFLAGGAILNVTKEEVPDERQSRFWAFAAGTAAYAFLVLSAGGPRP